MGRRGIVALILTAALLLVLGVIGWLAFTGLQAKSDLDAASRDLAAAQKALLAGDAPAAEATIARAAGRTESAQARTSDPVWTVVGAVPILGSTVRTVTVTAKAANQVASQGLPPLVRAVTDLQLDKIKQGAGALDLTKMPEVAAQLSLSGKALDTALDELASAPTNFVLGPVADARDSLDARTSEVDRAVTTSARVIAVLPTILGQDRPQTYFVAFQSPAEIRGTGGFLGTYAIMTVTKGRLVVDRVDSDTTLKNFPAPVLNLGTDYKDLYGSNPAEWVNMNLSPNFPYAGEQWAKAWQLQSGQSVDGVLGIDVTALQYLVEATGPVTTPDGRKLTAKEVVPYLTRDIYAEFEDSNSERKKFQASLATALLERTLAFDGNTAGLVKAIGQSVGGHNLQMWVRDPAAQQALAATPFAGATDQAPGPYVQLVLNNAAGNKMDYYLKRSVAYRGGACGQDNRNASVTITLANTLPATGPVPKIVEQIFVDGRPTLSRTNRSIVYVHLSNGAGVTSATLNGKATQLSFGQELGHPVAFTTLELPPGGVPVTLTLETTEPLSDETPRVPVQPMVQPQTTTVDFPTCS